MTYALDVLQKREEEMNQPPPGGGPPGEWTRSGTTIADVCGCTRTAILVTRADKICLQKYSCV